MKPFHIGAVLFPGFELLDVFGPLELLGMLEEKVKITMLAMSPGEVSSAQGLGAVADARLADDADYDLLLLPGGIGTRRTVQDVDFISTLVRHASTTRLVASVCTRASLLARAGLLDALDATTNKLVFDWVTTQGPRVNWIRRARWVVSGKYWTSSGVTAGMDMSLAIIQEVFGRDTAILAARQAEYVWNEDSSSDPFA